MDFLNNPAIVSIAQFLFGLAAGHFKWLKGNATRFIPWLNAGVGFVLKVIGGPAAAATTHPAVLSVLLAPTETMLALSQHSAVAAGYQPASLFGGFLGGIGAKALDAAWSAILMALVHDKLWQPMAGAYPSKQGG